MENCIRRYTRAYSVTIGNKTTVVHTENRETALDRAVTKLYGADCFWFADSGLPGYGQVFQALRPTKNNSNPGNSSVTYRVGKDIEPIGKPSRNFLKQRRADREENERIDAELKIESDREYAAYIAGISGDEFPFPDEPKQYSILWDEYRNGQSEKSHQKHIEDERRENAAAEIEQAKCASIERAQNEAIEENQRYDDHEKRVAAEVIRLRSIPLDAPIMDTILLAIARDVAVHTWIQNGRPGKMGDYKIRFTSGREPDLIREFLNSPMIYGRLEHVVD